MPICKVSVRDKRTGLDPKPCGTEYSSGKCPNRSNHVNKYRTGFCIDKHCEGTENKTSSGKYYKICEFWLTCPCDCHVKVSQLYKLAKLERKLPIQKYEPPHNVFVIPTREEVFAESQAGRPEPAVTLVKSESSEIPDRVSSTVLTSGSRVKRGALEEMIQACADDWITNGKRGQMHTGYVSKWIGEKYSINAPSRGAVDAVFKKWSELGFAFIATKPNRFAGYTVEGVSRGLLAMKADARRVDKFNTGRRA